MVNSVIEILMAFIGVLSFAVIFGAPRREYLYSGLTGAIGRASYILFSMIFMEMIYARLVAAIIITLVSRLFSKKRKVPEIVYLIGGMFSIVPGADIYYTAYYIFSHEIDLAMVAGIDAVSKALAIAFGIMIGSLLAQKIFKEKKKDPLF